MQVYTREEVAKHNQASDAWIIIGDGVFNVTKFVNLHPGGSAFIVGNAGKDVTEQFSLFHHDGVLPKYARLQIGTLAPADKKKVKRPIKLSEHSFGDMIPFADPLWYQRFNSPYYKQTHRDFRAKVRKFVDEEVLPTMHSWLDKDRPPQELYEKVGAAGFLACMHGPPYPTKYCAVPPPEDFDYFHELILFDEFGRTGHSGVIAALCNGAAIAASAVLRFGSEDLKARVAPPVFEGKKFIALAISEVTAGSDVAAITTRAVRDGDAYIVNGHKKWITNGTYAHFFITAVKTTEKGGHNGISFLVIERDMPGFTVRKLNIRDSDISGTAFLEFNNVRVPAKNLIGKENDGFKYIMHNFNHERFFVVVHCVRMCRICIEECVKFSLKRKTFGKTLSEHQVIRLKIAAMVRQTEQLQAWLEYITYQMCTMSHKEANQKLGDVICLLKAQCSKTMEYCARETTQIFGGNALHSTSVGRRIERMVASVKGYAIPAGAEDTMDDFAGRALFRLAKATAKL